MCPECDGGECCSSRLLRLRHTPAASPTHRNGWRCDDDKESK